MHQVKIDRKELLNIVQANREKHISDFNEAMKDYKQAVLKTAESNLKLAQTSDLEKINKIKNSPQCPTSYENNYSRAIRMLELSVETVIELSNDVFNQLVLDEWSWKNSFTTMSASYKNY